MDRYRQYDIRAASFDEFIEFLFDHDVVPIPRHSTGEPEPWYWHVMVTFDAVRIAGYYIGLFRDPRFLISRFSPKHLEQGFWAVQSGNLDCSVGNLIWHKGAPLEIRESCVRTMFHLFEKLFSNVPFETASNMWWDSLAYDWHCGNRSRANGGEDQFMQDVMFETLERILGLNSIECQTAALHGLGHLHHPKTNDLIERYIEQRGPIERGLRDYAWAAARFEVM